MELNTKIKIIERFDHYYSGINNKGAFILAMNTLIISSFVIGLKELYELETCNFMYLLSVSIAIIILLSIISMTITMSAIIPFTGSTGKSFWSFNDIGISDKATFIKEIDRQNDEQQNNDLNEQIHYLAVGLKSKHKKIKVALIFNILQFVLIGIVTFLLLFK